MSNKTQALRTQSQADRDKTTQYRVGIFRQADGLCVSGVRAIPVTQVPYESGDPLGVATLTFPPDLFEVTSPYAVDGQFICGVSADNEGGEGSFVFSDPFDVVWEPSSAGAVTVQ